MLFVTDNNSQAQVKEYFNKLDDLKTTNENLLDDMTESLKSGYDLEETNQQPVQAIDSALSEALERSASLFADPSISQNPSIAQSISTMQNIIALLEDYKSDLLDQNRSFRDIISQPVNAAEVNLIEAASQFLEPNELDGAVRQNMSASDVMGKIEDSKLLKKNKEFMLIHQQKVNEFVQAQTEKTQQVQKQAEQAVNPLGKEFGVLDTISKSMKHTDEIESQRVQGVEKDNKAKGIER